MASSKPPSRYVGPTEIITKHAKVWLYDAGTGELIAELTDEAAQAVRNAQHGPVRLTFNGQGEEIQVEP